MASKRKVVSIKGEMVDFDLLKIKNQIVQSPKTNDVVAREKFIDKRRRRTNRTSGTERKTSEMLIEQEQAKAQAQEAIKQQMDQHQKNLEQSSETLKNEVVPTSDVVAENNTKNNFERKIVI